MLMTSERGPAIRTMRGWAIDVLQDAGAIRECEEHGWMQDRVDPHARERAFDMARGDPPAGLSPDAAAAEIRDVLNSIGDTCPECPPVQSGPLRCGSECAPPDRILGIGAQRPSGRCDRSPDAAATSFRDSAPRAARLLSSLRADRGNPDRRCSPIVWRQRG